MAGNGGTRAVSEWYRSQVGTGEIADDAAQRDLASVFDDLLSRLAEKPPAATRRPLARLFRAPPPTAQKGLYIYGGVGRGKTMLMDVFFEAAPESAKRRAHFHGFMGDVHGRVHAARQETPDGDDPIEPVAESIARETRLLCLDEFSVEDIADAMILARLFRTLFEKGLVLVATSNTAPDDLYKHGLNRGLFLPFLDILKDHVDVLELKSQADYRLQKMGQADAYVVPADDSARATLDGLWRSFTHGEPGASMELPLRGRMVTVPRASGRVARFAFGDLCGAPLGTIDFAAIASAFDVVLIDEIPVITSGRRDVARRFINMVDVFYDAGVKILVSAAAEPDLLYEGGGTEAAAFQRTASRLIEMRSAAYLGTPRRRQAVESA